MAKLFGGSIQSALVHAATQYDIRESKKRGYNHYALAQYLMRIDDILADIDSGASPRDALCAGFNGRLLNALLKAIGESKASDSEHNSAGSWRGMPVYQPASERA